MAINLTENINHSGGGYIVSVGQSKGSWQTLANKSAFDAFTANSTTKQNLSNGQFFYVLDESQLYRLQVSGVGPFATYTLVSASFGSINTSSFVTNDETGSFVLVSQTSSMSVLNALSASFISDSFISASAARSGFGAGGSTPDGTISSSAQISALGYITSSDATTAALNLFTGSAQTSLTALNAATSSYLTSDITSSFVLVSQTSSMSVLSALTASFISDSFISASAARSGFSAGGSTPDGTISSSAQISALGYITSSNANVSALNTFTGSAQTSLTALNLFTGSVQTSLTALNAATSSYLTSDITSSFVLVSQTSSMNVLSALTASFISDSFISASAARSGFGSGGSTIPSGTISSSQQISDLGYITSSNANVSALNTFTGSAQTSLTALNAATSSYLTSDVTASFVTISQTSSMSVLNSVTASYISPSFISASAAAAGFGVGGSTDISALNVFTGSAQTSLTALNSATASYITNSQTSSMTVLSASYATYAVTASYTENLIVGGGITGSNWSISSDGVMTLGASSPTTASAGSIYYDGTDFYFGL
jgi:hypothetical protein